MSFLSSLLCCFDVQNNDSQETSITSHHPKLSKTQSNIQRALSNRQSQVNLSSSKSSSTDLKAKPAIGTPQKQQTVNYQSTNNSNISKNNNTHSNNKNNSTSKMKSTETNVGINDSSTIETAAVTEITDLKDSTDSSKDDDTINLNIDQQQQQQQAAESQRQLEQHQEDSTQQTFEDDELVDDEDDELYQDEEMDEEQFEELDLTRIQTDQVAAESGFLLNPAPEHLKNKKCLVLDLDETLVHSSFKYVRHCDFVIPVDIENQIHSVYVIKRPGVDEFLKRCGELFEVVVFTASVSRYGDPLLDILDVNNSIHHRLFRESCYNYQGNYIKNLSQMGRPLKDLIIIDNSPASYIFHPQHSVPISSWFSDTHDCELTDLLPFLEDLASSQVDDVGLVLDVSL